MEIRLGVGVFISCNTPWVITDPIVNNLPCANPLQKEKTTLVCFPARSLLVNLLPKLYQGMMDTAKVSHG